MPEIVDDSVEQGQSLLKPTIAGAAGIGVGSMLLGPGLGMPVGSIVSGAYIGGTEGNIITLAGGMFGLASLLFGNPFAGGMAASGGGSTQGVK